MADETIPSDRPPVITRAEAKALGLKRYFIGKPCKRGHVAEQLVAGGCVVCNKLRQAALRDANREKRAEKSRARYWEDPSKGRVRAAEYRKKNPEKTKASTDKWKEENREYVRQRRASYHARNAERNNARHARWMAANREEQREKGRARYWADPDKANAAKRAWRLKNPEKVKKVRDAWFASNPERTRAIWSNKRARKRAAEGSHTAGDVQRIYDAQKGKCACCKEKVGKKYHVDHIQPLSKGGSNFPANLQILCADCNVRKHNIDPLKFMRARGFLL